MHKPQLGKLRDQIWSQLAERPAQIPRITPAEALTPLGGWKTVLLAEALLRRFERTRRAATHAVDLDQGIPGREARARIARDHPVLEEKIEAEARHQFECAQARADAVTNEGKELERRGRRYARLRT